MSSDVFKVKKTRDGGGSKGRDQIGTLDSLHEKYVDELHTGSSDESVRALEFRLAELERELDGKFDPFVFDDVMRQSKLQAEHDTLAKTIENVREKRDIQKYYMESGDLMLDYYAPPGQ